ncbi:MAG: hypothetical protein Q9216_002725 [Gyalolechia sp. 2 TL-2023]
MSKAEQLGENGHETPKHDETDHLGRVPREGCATKIETQQQHDGKTNNGDASKPIDSFHAIGHARLRIVDIQEEEDENESQSGAREIDPEDPTPRCELGENTTEDWAYASRKSPNELTQA